MNFSSLLVDCCGFMGGRIALFSKVKLGQLGRLGQLGQLCRLGLLCRLSRFRQSKDIITRCLTGFPASGICRPPQFRGVLIERLKCQPLSGVVMIPIRSVDPFSGEIATE